VLIAGGLKGTAYLATAEIYTPSTGKFKKTNPMATARDYQSATLLSDGRILIAGGEGKGAKILASAEVYDPKTAAFGPVGNMQAARKLFTATTLPDGTVLIAGGISTTDGLASAELFAK
jgi:hypothetical protein